MNAVIRFVVPTLGRNIAWLKQCLRSISSQDVAVELVVIAPETAQIGELVESHGGRLVKEVGASLSAALNQGFRGEASAPIGATIKYFAWLGDDDILAPGSLRHTLGAMESRPTASFVFGRVRYIDGDGKSKWVVRSGSWAAYYARFGANFLAQPGSLIRRADFERVGGLDESLSNSMDQDLFLKLSDVGRVAYVPFEVASFRVHNSSISSTKGDRDERRLVSERYRPVYPKPADVMLRPVVRATDKVLLSLMSRIPGPVPAEVNGRVYYSA